jgi:hypothetical protein
VSLDTDTNNATSDLIDIERGAGGSSVQLSDFCAEFKPFHQGLNVSLAPVDRFRLLRPIMDAPRGRTGKRNSGEAEAKGESVDNAELTKEGVLRCDPRVDSR